MIFRLGEKRNSSSSRIAKIQCRKILTQKNSENTVPWKFHRSYHVLTVPKSSFCNLLSLQTLKEEKWITKKWNNYFYGSPYSFYHGPGLVLFSAWIEAALWGKKVIVPIVKKYQKIPRILSVECLLFKPCDKYAKISAVWADFLTCCFLCYMTGSDYVCQKPS